MHAGLERTTGRTFPHPQHLAVPKKKINTLHVGAANSYCTIDGRETADVKQTQKMITFNTCEVSLGQHVCELVLGVNVFDLDLGVQINSIEQPIKSNSVSSGSCRITNQEQLCGFWMHVSL